jgi:hypothetical protein
VYVSATRKKSQLGRKAVKRTSGKGRGQIRK